MPVKRVLVLKGSPRERGNSSLLAEQVAAGSRAAGAEVEVFHLHSMDIRPCDACDICREARQGCIIEDDMQILYPKLQNADAIVVASPIYWFTISAQTKLFIDRWYALEGASGNLLAGKQFGVVLTYGDTDPYTSGAINAIHTFQDIFRYLHAELVGIIYGTALEAGEIQNQPALMEQARKLGLKLGG